MRLDVKDRTLSDRVRTAQRMHAGGADSEAIGAVLGVAPSTVERYLKARPCVDCGDPVVKGSAHCQRCGRRRSPTGATKKWTPELVVAALRAYEQEFGRPPTREALNRAGRDYPSPSTVRRYLGSFGAALRAARLRSNSWNGRWTRQRIVDAMRDFHSETGYWPRLSDWAVASTSWPTHRTVRIRFGSWQAALRAAAGPSLDEGEEPPVRPENRPEKKWTREQIVNALRSFVEEFGRVPTPKDLTPPPSGYPWIGTLRQNFDSFSDALNAAGLEPSERQPMPERIIEAMLRFRRAYGRWPRATDWSRASEDWPSERTVRNCFGSWRAAVDVAMERGGSP
jgi:Homing endonuclease associated repeat